jgi:predicted DNA-binding protein
MPIETTVDLSPEIFERLKLMAARTGQTPEEFMVSAVLDYIREREEAALAKSASNGGQSPDIAACSCDVVERKESLDE